MDVGRGREGPTSKGREGIGGKGRGKGEEGRGRESGRGERSASRGGLTPLLLWSSCLASHTHYVSAIGICREFATTLLHSE